MVAEAFDSIDRWRNATGRTLTNAFSNFSSSLYTLSTAKLVSIISILIVDFVVPAFIPTRLLAGFSISRFAPAFSRFFLPGLGVNALATTIWYQDALDDTPESEINMVAAGGVAAFAAVTAVGSYHPLLYSIMIETGSPLWSSLIVSTSSLGMFFGYSMRDSNHSAPAADGPQTGLRPAPAF